MSRTDRLKEEIGWLKVVFGLLVAVDVSLLAWLGQNYATASGVIVFIGLAATILVSGAIVWVNKAAYKRIQELEDV